MDFSGHIFTLMFEALSTALAGIIGRYSAIVGIVDAPLRAAIVIYLTMLGYAVMRGAIQYPFREFVYRGAMLTFLYFALTSLYGAQIGLFALGGLPSQFANALGGADAGGLGGFFDQLVGSGYEVAEKIQKNLDFYNESQEGGALGLPSGAAIGRNIAAYLLQILVILIAIFTAAIGFTISAFALFALALLSVVGPLFVAALLFDSTRGYFFAWLGALINYLMLVVFALVVTLFITQTTTTVLGTIIESDDIFTSAAKAIGFYALGFFFFFQIPALAAGLGGGAPALATQFAQAISRSAAAVAGGVGGAAVLSAGRSAAGSAARATGRGIARGFAQVTRRSGSVSNAAPGRRS